MHERSSPLIEHKGIRWINFKRLIKSINCIVKSVELKECKSEVIISIHVVWVDRNCMLKCINCRLGLFEFC